MSRTSLPVPTTPKEAAIAAAAKPPVPMAGFNIQKMAYLPERIPDKTWGLVAIKDAPWFRMKAGDLFLAEVADAEYLCAEGYARRTFGAVTCVSQFEAGALIGSRVVSRVPEKCRYDDAIAAIQRCDFPFNGSQDGHPEKTQAGAYAGAVQIVPEDFDPAELPPDPRPSPMQPAKTWADAPAVMVRPNVSTTFCGEHFRDQEPRQINEVIAVLGQHKLTRHGEPVLVAEKLTPQGERFNEAVAKHVKKFGRDWNTADPGFPVYWEV
jgi:hypothetical protein